jgi:hypothetical protein
MSEARLQRLRGAERLTLGLGVAASVTANILHVRPNPISQAILRSPPTSAGVRRAPLQRPSSVPDGFTASTGRPASRRICWALLPRMNMPTRDRRRSPMTITDASI